MNKEDKVLSKCLVEAYTNYITYLTKQYMDIQGIARIHGYKISTKDFLLGEQLRRKIDECKNKIEQ